MKKFKNTIVISGILLIFMTLGNISLYADGCYLCGSGSSSNCKDYCRYTGSDTFENRKKCEKAGCKITGTASCPTAANYKICNAFTEQRLIKRLVNFYKTPIKNVDL
ncbi:MAG: hypothetical protein ACK4UJ_02345 [Leptonema sp. (in: bacteria)]